MQQHTSFERSEERAAELASLARKLQLELEVKDRKWRLRTYKQCFVGEEAVNRIAAILSVAREDAVNLGRELLTYGFISHVVGDHDFKDGYLFYCFTDAKGARDEESSAPESLRLVERALQLQEEFGDFVKGCAEGDVSAAFQLRLDTFFAAEREVLQALRQEVSCSSELSTESVTPRKTRRRLSLLSSKEMPKSNRSSRASLFLSRRRRRLSEGDDDGLSEIASSPLPPALKTKLNSHENLLALDDLRSSVVASAAPLLNVDEEKLLGEYSFDSIVLSGSGLQEGVGLSVKLTSSLLLVVVAGEETIVESFPLSQLMVDVADDERQVLVAHANKCSSLEVSALSKSELYPFLALLRQASRDLARTLVRRFCDLLFQENLLLARALVNTFRPYEDKEPMKAMMLTLGNKGLLVALINSVLGEEVRHSAAQAVLFREDSVGSALLNQMMKSSAVSFLQQTVGAFIGTMSSDLNLEQDVKSLSLDDLKAKQSRSDALMEAAQSLFDLLVAHVTDVSTVLRRVFSQLVQHVAAKYPGAEHSTLGSFVFLRLICPALVLPSSYGLGVEVGSRKKRNLLLISRLLQLLATGVTEIADAQLAKCLPFVRRNVEKLKYFYDTLCSVGFEGSINLPADPTKLNQAKVLLYQFAQSHNSSVMEAVGDSLSEEGRDEELLQAFYSLPPLPLLSHALRKYTQVATPKSGRRSTRKDSMRQRKRRPSEREVKTGFSEYDTSFVNEVMGAGGAAAWIEHQASQCRFVMIVFYRGSFCHFCRREMKAWDEYGVAIRDLGGLLVGVCADALTTAIATRGQWKIETYQLVGDPTLRLARKWDIHISKQRGFPDGMSQPGIVVYTVEEGTVLYRWASSPSIKNLFGARDRPNPKTVMNTVLEKVKQLE